MQERGLCLEVLVLVLELVCHLSTSWLGDGCVTMTEDAI